MAFGGFENFEAFEPFDAEGEREAWLEEHDREIPDGWDYADDEGNDVSEYDDEPDEREYSPDDDFEQPDPYWWGEGED